MRLIMLVLGLSLAVAITAQPLGAAEQPSGTAIEQRVRAVIQQNCALVRRPSVACDRVDSEWSCFWTHTRGYGTLAFDDEPEGIYCPASGA
jgi:hypothetical protein